MSIYDPLSEALGIESSGNLDYLNPIRKQDLELILEVPPCMSEETKKVLSDYWKDYWSDKVYPQYLRDKISKSLKGRVFSEQHLLRKSEAQKRKISVNGITYDSGQEAAKVLGVSPACIVKWAKNGKANYIERQ